MSSRVLGNSLVSAAAKREFALNPFSPINKPCLHRTLHIGNKMVFLSSLLDASSSTLSSHCVQSCFLTPLLPRIFQKIFKIAQFSFETISAPQHAHIPSYTPQPRVPHHPPFPIPVFAVKKNQLPPLQRKIQLPLIKPIFWGIHCIQNGMWMHFARCAFGQGW